MQKAVLQIHLLHPLHARQRARPQPANGIALQAEDAEGRDGLEAGSRDVRQPVAFQVENLKTVQALRRFSIRYIYFQ